MIYFSYGLAWLSTAIAVSVGIYITGSAWCLWAFLLPASISISSKSSDNEDKEEDYSE